MKLPIADTRDGPGATRACCFRKHRRPLVLIAVLHTLAATAGLAGPWLLGMLVDAVTGGTTATYINTLIAVGVVAVLAQTVLIRFAQRASMVFGEEVFAELREEFIEKVTALPLSVVERAGTGDLVARTTNDVNKLQHAVRFGVPRVIVAVVTIALTIVACLVLSPVVSIAMFVGVPTLLLVVRWYLKRATPAYQRESAAYAVLNGTITESVEGARTVDALRLGRRRMGRVRRRPARGVRGREGDAAPAHDPVPGHRRGVRAGARGRAAVGRVPRVGGLRHGRRGHHDRAVHVPDHRSGVGADLLGRRDPGGGDVARAHRGRPAGRARPRGARGHARSTRTSPPAA